MDIWGDLKSLDTWESDKSPKIPKFDHGCDPILAPFSRFGPSVPPADFFKKLSNLAICLIISQKTKHIQMKCFSLDSRQNFNLFKKKILKIALFLRILE